MTLILLHKMTDIAGAALMMGLLVWLALEVWLKVYDANLKLFRVHKEFCLWLYHRRRFKRWMSRSKADKFA